MYNKARCVFDIHNMGYQGPFPNPPFSEAPPFDFSNFGLRDNAYYDKYFWVYPEQVCVCAKGGLGGRERRETEMEGGRGATEKETMCVCVYVCACATTISPAVSTLNRGNIYLYIDRYI